MSMLVKAIPTAKAGEIVAETAIRTSERVTVETPAGNVYISHDPVQGLFVTVRGEKATTTVKFNEKAVV